MLLLVAGAHLHDGHFVTDEIRTLLLVPPISRRSAVRRRRYHNVRLV